MNQPLEQVPHGRAEPSLGAELYGQYRTGQLTERDYYIMSAALVAKHAHEERAHVYTPMPQQVGQYIDRRLQGSDYDPHLAKNMGIWRVDVFRAMDHNLYMVGHFEWAREKCQSVGLEGEVLRLSDAIRRFQSLHFPAPQYLKACDVVKLDSEARERMKRGAS